MRKIAVADIGSNSARLVVMRRFGDAAPIPVAESKLSLRLQLAIDHNGAIPDAAVARIISLLKDFKAVADASGAEALIAVGTSALRDSVNAKAVIASVWQGSGVQLRALTGEEEARLGFQGAVNSVPVVNGAAVDVGGGSMELVRFIDRQPVTTLTLPLGALKVTDEFLADGGTEKSVAALTAHIDRLLAGLPVEPLTGGDRLIGTGGTIRNLAKMHRRRSSARFARLHGHSVPVSEIVGSIQRLASMKPARRKSVPGLNPERAGSIIGGACSTLGAAALLGADSILVSGAGLREGLAMEAFGAAPYSRAGISRKAARDMAVRFATWEPDKATRRAAIIGVICDALGDAISPELREAAELAAEVLDTGVAVDFYSRYEAAAWLIVNSDTGALTHRQVALMTAICLAGQGSSPQAGRFKGEIKPGETDELKKAGAVLALADEIEMRLGPGGASTLSIQPSQRSGEALTISWDGSDSWNNAPVRALFKSAFKRSVGV
jgi:exopolyphosphatase/guanosine-5'-triphosphate,3'-diphosphate pyrophosphatase